MMFLARRRWLAFESTLLTIGDMQRLSLGAETEDVYRGFVAEKDKLVWESAGDWEREPHGGETGDVAEGVWEGLVVEVLWPTIGDWHLDPHGEVVVPIWRDPELGTAED